MINFVKKEDVVTTLWTGGWDSTFHVCNTILVKKAKVQPIYIIDANRQSFPIEIRTMEKIKTLLIEKDNSAKERIFPTFFFSAKDVKENFQITAGVLRLRKKYHLGGQYDWLIRFPEQFNLTDLELSSHTLRVPHVISKDNDEMIPYTDNVGNKYLRITDTPKDPDMLLFRYFKFVNMFLSKTDMGHVAKKEGFLDIMNVTWFCHRPRKGLKPCGTCSPCLIAIREGMRHKLSKPALFKGYVATTIKKMRYSDNERVKRMVDFIRKTKRILGI